MKNAIIIVISIINAALGFISFELFPLAYLIATNTMKGHVNNPDGEMFVPLGFAMLLFIPLTVILGNVYMYKKQNMRKSVYAAIQVFCFLAGAFFAIRTWNNYSALPHIF